MAIAVRISRADAKKLGFHAGMPVTMRIKNHNLVIESTVKEPVYTLEELLKTVTSENHHAETDWGVDMGEEVLDPW